MNSGFPIRERGNYGPLRRQADCADCSERAAGNVKDQKCATEQKESRGFPRL
jgi:hypothetical protein